MSEPVTTMDREIHKEDWDYLGDGVYAGFDGFGIMLHANDHRNPTDRVYLEPSVIDRLNAFMKRKCDERSHRSSGTP